MEFKNEFVPLALENLRREAAFVKADGWRFVQTHAVNTDKGIDLYYSFMKDGLLRNYHIEGVTPDMLVPSITDMFLAAFVFENEARELFGVNMGPIAIDFDGAMYNPPDANPMTFISPEQKAAKEKARKVAAAKAAKEKSASDIQEAKGSEEIAVSPGGGRRRFKMTPELQARLDAKMPSLTPEKVAKVEAALAALADQDNFPNSNEEARSNARKEGEQLASQSPAEKAVDATYTDISNKQLESNAQLPVDKELEEKLAAMDPAKAERVRKAFEGRNVASEANDGKQAVDEPPTDIFNDEEMEKLLSLMDADRAAKVLKAFSQKEGE